MVSVFILIISTILTLTTREVYEKMYFHNYVAITNSNLPMIWRNKYLYANVIGYTFSKRQ